MGEYLSVKLQKRRNDKAEQKIPHRNQICSKSGLFDGYWPQELLYPIHLFGSQHKVTRKLFPAKDNFILGNLLHETLY